MLQVVLRSNRGRRRADVNWEKVWITTISSCPVSRVWPDEEGAAA
jgi:hypothetical protein